MKRFIAWLRRKLSGQFTIYFDQVPMEMIPKRRWKMDRHHLLKLTGVNVSVGTKVVAEPVYLPLYSWEKDGNVAAFDWYGWGTKPTSMFFLPQWPFVWMIPNGEVRFTSSED